MVDPRQFRRVLLLLAFIAGGSIPAFAFGLQDALDRIDSTTAVHAAQSALEAAQANLHKLSFAGDPSLTASPQAKATTEFAAPFPEQTLVSATIAARVPMGLSEVQKLQVAQAEAAVQTAREQLTQVRSAAYETIYGLYMQAWLAQREQEVLKAELAAARGYSTAIEEQFRSGKVSFIDLTSADDDLRNREAASAHGGLEQRLSWLRLTTAIGLPYAPDTPKLEPDPAFTASLDLPKPPELVDWALDRDVALRMLVSDIDGTNRQVALLERPNLSSSLQLLGEVSNHNFSLSYTFDQPQLGASYTIPIYANGTIPGSNSNNLTDTWAVGVGFSLAFSTGKSNSLETAGLKAQLSQQEVRLEERRSSLQLDVRARYQEWLTSKKSVALANGALDRAKMNKTIVDSRRSLGLASDYELLQSTAFTARAEYALEAARSTARMKFLAAANSAGYLSKVIDSFENGGKE